jgi:hypothetical protein
MGTLLIRGTSLFHRELAAQLQELTASDSNISDFDILKAIAKKTSTVLSQLRTLAATAPSGAPSVFISLRELIFIAQAN